MDYNDFTTEIQSDEQAAFDSLSYWDDGYSDYWY